MSSPSARRGPGAQRGTGRLGSVWGPDGGSRLGFADRTRRRGSVSLTFTDLLHPHTTTPSSPHPI